MDHLFNRLDGAYPGRFKAAFPSPQSIDNWRSAWVEAFVDDGITPAEVKAGIAACRTIYDWPPSLCEFVKACRPDRTEELFRRAQRLVFLSVNERDYGGDSVLYWSIQRFGEHELKTASSSGQRWRLIVSDTTDENRRGLLPCIPERREALPAPGHASISREEAEKRVKSMGLNMNPRGDRAWAQRIIERAKTDERLPLLAEKFAAEAACPAV